MSFQLVISDQALTDLSEQFNWYAVHSNDAVAERFLKAYRAAAEMLLSMPELAPEFPIMSPETIGFRSLGFRAVWQVCDLLPNLRRDNVIERVMHGARDVPRRFHEC